ncbi:hypothetical protein [Nonomuraea fuscirosea]|uniref:hypothetical protein n=1 Tax=Nonomuraea fuscirosea TaxID=1291556 RepID=UPI0034219A74
MLKEACAAGVLTAAIFAPTSASSAPVTAPVVTARTVTTGTCTSAVCKWMEEGKKRCYYCKQKKKRGGGWKRQYCQKKAKEKAPVELECTSAAAPTTSNPKRVCEKCVDQKTGRLVSTKCG